MTNLQHTTASFGLRLDRRRGPALHAQIYERIRAVILAGRLGAGSRLPSSRGLASDLAVSRATVELAYARLAGEGYILGRGAAGTVVAPRLAPRAAPERQAPMAAPRRAPSVSWPAMPVPIRPFQLGVPALDAFPRKLWARLTARRGRRLGLADMVYQPAHGMPALRAAIASYLGVARGIACDPAQIFITAGYQGALGLLSRALLRPGEQAWIEDPAYPPTQLGLTLAGALPVPVPVDADGLDVVAGRRRAGRARLAVVTPSHQSPLGVGLALDRRLALLAWAAEAGAWIVEDDYDGEFHYRGRPLPALKSLDGAGRVLYVGTFTKVLSPGLRLGYVVAPEALVDRLAAAAGLLQPPPDGLAQLVVADLMAEGHFGRHVRRMRQLYAERRSALLDALRDAVDPRRSIDDLGGGLHLLLRLGAREHDVALAKRAQAQGLAPQPLTPFALRARCRPGLLLGFTNLAAEAAPSTARRLLRAIDD